jgi:hypothetical protein
MLENPINRAYVRANTWSVTAKVNEDKEAGEWADALVLDLAAGGLLFLTHSSYEPGNKLWFDMQIDPMAPGIGGKIPMIVRGEIRGDRGMRNGMHAFSVAFTEISQSDRIRLDELVRMTVNKYRIETEADFLNR